MKYNFLFLMLALVNFLCCKNQESISEEKVLNGTSASDWETDVYKLPGGTGFLIPDFEGGTKSRLIATARHVVKKGDIKSKDEDRILEVLETLDAPPKDQESIPDLKILVLKDCVTSKNKITLRSFESNSLISSSARGFGYGLASVDANEIPQIADKLNAGQLRINRTETVRLHPGEKYTAFVTVADDDNAPSWCPGDSGGPIILQARQERFWVGTLTAYY